MTNEIDTKLCDVMREFVLLNKSVADPNLMDVSKLQAFLEDKVTQYMCNEFIMEDYVNMDREINAYCDDNVSDLVEQFVNDQLESVVDDKLDNIIEDKVDYKIESAVSDNIDQAMTDFFKSKDGTIAIADAILYLIKSKVTE
ncbi:MAG: hypothetical protein JHC33_04595 [Ignisphaera sp.]|jgi:hypothetical protein|nr:hypothetical protein [Ignisphaera sp.]